tara:strand:- start:61 stop:576 length:516 start_codon:yes stop_codon:yes gene_type:complete
MKKLLLVLLCLPPLFNSCGVDDSNVFSNGKSIIEDKPVNSFHGHSNQKIISLFLDYMDWYKEGIEFDRTNIQVRKIDNHTYSIKFKSFYWENVDKFCVDGMTCMQCLGMGTKQESKDYGDNFYSNKVSWSVECDPCKGKGTINCAKRKKSYIKIATMNFKDTDSFSLIFHM